ncbi:MAG: hypothetical protein HY472_01520 [Candidatus Sungbacteria bacterium]|nr:hypothetical protein [Candidatus Sungbacteria bacterium]
MVKTAAFAKMKEYERQAQVFTEKYKTQFDAFEKNLLSSKKENTALWDDYLIWKGVEEARKKWMKRYEES